MAFNNGYPVTYQQYYNPSYTQPVSTPPLPVQYQQPIQPPQAQPQQPAPDIVWVQGEAGAKSYLVAKNSAVALWDSESPVIYIKSVDATGVPSMVILDYKMREPEKEDNSSQKELNELKAKLDMIISELGIGKEVNNEQSVV